MSDNAEPHEMNALWRLLSSEPIQVIGPADLTENWETMLSDACAEQRAGVVIVVVDRRLAHLVRWLLSRGKRARHRQPSPRRLRRHLESLGTVEAVYDLWPSGVSPNVAWETSDSRTRTWAQVSGILGLGGRSTLVRAALRSRLASSLVKMLTPAGAVVVRPSASHQP
jgi:hypothetical protein